MSSANFEQPTEVSIPFQELIFRDIRVQGSLIASPGESRRMLKIVDEHRISVKTNSFNGLREIGKVLDLARSGKMKGKGIIVVDQDQIKKEKESGLEMV
jgi:alcohol dehydrogenase, propanol-preferring